MSLLLLAVSAGCFLDRSPSIACEADRINAGFCFLVGLKKVSEK